VENVAAVAARSGVGGVGHPHLVRGGLPTARSPRPERPAVVRPEGVVSEIPAPDRGGGVTGATRRASRDVGAGVEPVLPRLDGRRRGQRVGETTGPVGVDEHPDLRDACVGGVVAETLGDQPVQDVVHAVLFPRGGERGRGVQRLSRDIVVR